MKYFIFLSLSLILISSVHSDVPNVSFSSSKIHHKFSIDKNERVLNIRPQEISFDGKINSTETKQALLNLNRDVQLEILEDLDWKDLLSVAQTNKYLKSLANYVFERKLADKVIEIVDPNSDLEKHCRESNINCNNTIYIHGLATTGAFLEQFGGSIHKLKIVYDLHGKKYQERKSIYKRKINELVSLHCSESLRQIELVIRKDVSFFNQMKKPFKRVENVTIGGQYKTLGNSVLNFTGLFPVMRRLYLPLVEIADKSFIDQKFSHLEHLEVKILDRPGSPLITEADLIAMLKRNPQIGSLTLGKSTRPLLHTINEFLPNVEELDLLYYMCGPDDSEDLSTISFKNLKKLTIYPGPHQANKKIIFENLIELHTDTYASIGNWWSDAIKKSKDLKQLHLQRGCASEKTLSEITSADLKLTEMTLSVCREVSHEYIIDFIRKCQYVGKFRFNRFYPDISLKLLGGALHDKLTNEWTINQLSHAIILRRNSFNEANHTDE